MKRLYGFSILTVLISLCLSTLMYAQTEVSGTINGDSAVVWTVANSPYIITGSTTISDLDTVQIESGVEVRFNSSTQLTVTGSLIADGVTFTANSGTGRESWNRIYLNSASSRLDLSNSTIQFATNGVDVANGTASLDTVIIADSKYGMAAAYPGKIILNQSTITGTVYPIYINSEADISYMGTNDLSGNDNDVIFLNFSGVDVNWTLNNAGIPYYFYYSMQVYSGDTLSIASGNILKFTNAKDLYTQDGGVIHAVAEVGEEIHFTSWKNDNAGGDTNNDGNTTAPANNDWYGIRINGNTAQSTFKRVRVTFAGYHYTYYGDYRGGITLINNNSVIDSSNFQNNLYGVVLRDNSDATFTNNTIGSSGVVPVALTFDSNPAFSNNSFSSSNNQYDAIGLIGTTIQGSSVLPKRDFTSIPNVTYLLLRDLYIDTGAELTIEQGVVIKSTGPGLKVKGTLTSVGTTDEKIVFTSVKDDNVGNPKDTNKDGNNTVPGNTDWIGIAFGEDAGASVIDHNRIRYATYNTNFYYNVADSYLYPKGAINIVNSNVTISNSEIANTQYFAIDSRGTAKPTITNNSFSNTGSVPVALSLTSDPTFSGNTLANVGLIAIGYHGETITADGIIRNRDFAGYEEITTVLLGASTVASGSTLTIEPGTVIKVVIDQHAFLRIEGALISDGTVDSTIFFTSIYDDQIGNPLDTNGDGGATTPSPDNWGTIRFMSTSDDATSSVSETEIRYAKHGMIFTNAAPTIDKVTVLSCRYMGFGMESGSTVHIANSTIQNCGYDPVAISTNAAPTFANITFNSNGSNGVGLLESNSLSTYYYSFNSYGYFYETTNTVSADATLSPYSFAGYTNLPFIMRNTWYIGQNTILSVAPTVIFKGTQSLYVDGALKVLGTETEPVIFTSVSDDGAGGDSNNDGNITVPNPGQSIRIYFRASSLDSVNHITNAEFRYPSTAIEFQSSKGKVENSLFQLSQYDAINIYDNSSPQILSNYFQNITGHSIYMDMFSNPTFSGNTESNVKHRGLGIRGGTWGSDATLPFRSFAGIDSITYVLHGNFTIPSGSKIIIPAGMTLKAFTNYGGYRYTSGEFNVEGALRVNGTENSPVVFTIDTDDSYGKPADIYTDGQVNDFNYRYGNWITYSSTSDDTSNIVNYAIFRNNNAGIVANSADPTVKNSRFEQLNYGLNLMGVSAPFVENNVFHNLNKTPLIISLVSYPQTTIGNIMSGTTWRAIGVREETLVQDVTLPKRDFGGKIGIPYYMSGNYTTGTGAVLTIDPGVIIKFENYRRLEVQKGLIAQGRNHPDSLIVFTTILDDFYGGDTNGDSTATNSTSGYWYGIKYSGTSLPEESLLDYTVIKDVRVNSNSYAGVLADNASPTITNSSIFNNAYGVVVWGSGNPVVNNNDIYNNSQFGVYNRDKTFTIDATNNWWGSDTGPTHSANPGGTGDIVTDGVNYNPFNGGGATNPVLGDVSLNGKVQSYDASVILQHTALIETMNPTQISVADVSGNGDVSSLDASYILQYVVGLIDVFPVELMSKARKDVLAALEVKGLSLKLTELTKISENQYAVKLVLNNTHGLYAFDVELSYPEDALSVEEIKLGDFLSDAAVSTNSSKAGKVFISVASGTSFKGNGSIAELIITTQKDEISTISIDKFFANEMDYTEAAEHEEVQLNLPEEFELYQNYPNPFNPTTTIGFNLADNNVKVNLVIYNVLGQKVKTLISDVYQAGRYRAVWDGTNDAGMPVSTGVYIYRIQAGDIVQSKKLTFIK